MKVQQVSCLIFISSLSFTTASLLDFKYDFCASSSLFSSINPLCEQKSFSLIELPHLSGPEDLLILDHDHNHNHKHQHDPSHAPWAHPPQCIPLRNSTTRYCVYTSTSFASDRGISFFASSIHSQALHNLDSFKDPSLLEGTNAISDPRFMSKPIPGKGLGLVALRPIHRGEELFRSTPALILENEELEEEQRRPYYNVATRQLPKATKKMFDDLKGHFGGDPVLDKINTNCFAVDLDLGADTSIGAVAVFPEMSRMNHDCRPNAHYYFNPHTLIQHVHALRTILPGEEITISYIDPAKPSSERKETLSNSWGFPCGCNSCNAPDPVRAASDARVADINQLTGLLNDYTATSVIEDAEEGVRIAELLVRLYELEGLLGPISEAYAYAALEYSNAMRKWEALRYAHMAIEAGLLYGGPGDADVMGMQEFVANPEGHWSWGVRARRRFYEASKEVP